MNYYLLGLILRKLRNLRGKKWLIPAVIYHLVICSVMALPVPTGTVLQQQTRKVTGTVLSKEDNQPIIGANVFVEGTSLGSITDADGKFTLSNVPDNVKTIKVSYLGMKAQTLSIQSDMIILMENDTEFIDEVIVVAYGTAKKSSFTGSASQIKAEKFETRPLTNVTSALLGATPGVQVSSANGQPGSESNIYIRGIGSFSASNTPLIVLNGMPYDNSISSINPSDIESISVLKDASSAALYGARGGNGVILINTKTGNKDRMTVNVKFHQGITARQSNDYETLNVEDYLTVHWENTRNQLIKGGMDPAAAAQNAASNLITNNLKYNPWNVPDDQVVDANGKLNPNAKFMWGDDTDWLNAIQQLGNRTEAGINVGGGNNKSDYYLSVGYLTEKGYIIGSQFDRYTINTNVNSQITSFLKIGGTLSGNISESTGNQNESSNGNSNPFRFVRYIGPIYPIHRHDPVTKDYLRDENGNLLYDFGQDGRDYIGGNNPAIELQNIYDEFRRNTLNAKAYSEIRFLDGFKLTLNGSVGANAYLAHSAGIYYPEKDNQGTVTSTKSNSFTTTWTFNQLLTYAKDIDRHHLDVMIGHESYDWTYNYLSVQKKGMSVNNGNYEFANYAEIGDEPGSYKHVYRTEGYIARLNYDYADRYFLSASARRDGSSRFYKDARWGNFYSVGAGWRIDREDFMKNLSFVDLLKLRVSYGEVGNDDINTYYGWQTMYVLSPNGLESGYIQDQVIRNKELLWEKSQSSDVALEYTLFNNRLSGSIEFFNRQSSNLLFEIPQPVDAGFTDAYKNAGTMYNRGVEIDVNGQIVKTKNMIWSVGLNATWLKNKITYLPLDAYNELPHRIEEGHSRYEFYLRQWAGVDPATGNAIYVPSEEIMEQYNNATDAEKEAMSIVKINDQYYTTVVGEALRDWSGQSMPTVSGGLTTGVTWKGISLNLLFNYQLGGKMYDAGYSSLMTEPYGSALLGSTRHIDILSRWQNPGDITNVPRIDFGNTDLYASSSTRWLVSSDMLELANATLSYDIPKQWLNRFEVHGLRVYASGDNLLLFTKRQGIYPRRNIFSGYAGNIDLYLPSRVFTFGLNLTF
ncbi:MAG: TonB-dependent receptor [Dysgonamonadaceae bacterium]|jgi:TonB-linked SusC/RagA family outer membrane protein|nr:TonB-dependent receptor [Dysgonamonadaceae bacterium]